METVPLDVAYARLGADVAGRQRPIWATAGDGSLVLMCQSAGFSRPATGILRYSAQLSRISSGRSQVASLRTSLQAALSGGTPVKLIIHTPGVGRLSGRVHLRSDLVGSVTTFDGDAYSVDFVRIPEASPPSRSAVRRKR